MSIAELLSTDRMVCAEGATSKKKVLEQISGLLATAVPDLSSDEIFESLIGRERLGSTGLGHGVALPHGRIRGGDRAVGAFMKLRQAIDFDALDDQPVDLLFGLLVPEHYTDEHLQILAELARLFENPEYCEKIRASNDCHAILDMIAKPSPAKT